MCRERISPCTVLGTQSGNHFQVPCDRSRVDGRAVHWTSRIHPRVWKGALHDQMSTVPDSDKDNCSASLHDTPTSRGQRLVPIQSWPAPAPHDGEMGFSHQNDVIAAPPPFPPGVRCWRRGGDDEPHLLELCFDSRAQKRSNELLLLLLLPPPRKQMSRSARM